uniref:Protein NATD1 n=1 Tax=Plectus sambesii TaxID=2011161 RepID=A0A914VIX5_9BILA
MSHALKVEHCRKALEFFIKINGSKAVLQYKELPNGILDMYHTEVPPEARGKGVAKVLADAAFSYAGKNGLKIIPTCTYIDKYARDFATPEQKALIVHSKSGL